MSESPLQRDLSKARGLKPLLMGLVVVLFLAGASIFTYSWFNHNVSIKVDGKTLQLNTFKTTVRDVLGEANVQLRAEDVVQPTLSTEVVDDLKVVVTRAFPVSIAVGTARVTVMTVGCTVRELLQLGKVEVRKNDKVFPSLDTRVAPMSIVRVMRVDEKMVKETAPIAFTTKRSSNPSMDRGKAVVVAKGTPGLLEKTFKLKVVDGKVVSRILVGKRVLQAASPRVISVGVRLPLNMLSTSRGRYTYRKVYSMTATAYNGRGRQTAGGYRSGYGVVAVDPRVISLGTKVYVEGYGLAVAGDTGGAIRGQRIDLGYHTTSDAMRFGRRRVRVYVLEK